MGDDQAIGSQFTGNKTAGNQAPALPESIASHHPYSVLTPDCILDALEQHGFTTDGTLLALNSYENRVYAFRSDSKQRFVVKFYRPLRWSREQIQEEHDFLFFLSEREIPVIAPLRDEAGLSLHTHLDFYFAVFPQRGGRAFETGDVTQLEVLGRTVGRLHAAAEFFPFKFRETLSVEMYAGRARTATLACAQLPAHLHARYQAISGELLMAVSAQFAALGDLPLISAHGDMHAGNALWTGEEVLLVDFDDARRAPAVQDLWMLAHDNFERDVLISEYEGFCDFDWRQWQLVEPLRAMRMVQYTGWLATRWSDPSFPHHFPWFNTPNYFEEQCQLLEQQLQLVTGRDE